MEMINLFNINVEIIGSPTKTDEPCVLVGNHISYLDIPVLMFAQPDVTFVSKKEVSYWPIIGSAAKKAQTIFVTRSNRHSRSMARDQIAKSLKDNCQKVAIFPSGTTSIYRSAFWKKGAFEIAQKNSFKVQPFRLKYHPLSEVSYVGKDNFITHMFALFELSKIKVTIEFHEPVLIDNAINDCLLWKQWCEH